MKENGFEYIDLGLPSKTMWATCNVGADNPEDSGLLFQFGRVDGYRCDDKNNKFRTNKQNKQDTYSEEMPVTSSGKVYTYGEILDLADDAAHVNMGGAWKMPTKDELEELVNNTTQEVETINGVKGMLFASNINKRQLFIPFMQGYWYNGTWYSLNKACTDIWASQVRVSSTVYAYRIYCSSANGVYVNNFFYRSAAFSVRGVFKSNDTSNEHTNNINMLI